MKMSKADFKGMIKECIRELIKDGAFADVLAEGTNKQPAPQQSSFRTAAKELISTNAQVVDRDKLKAQAERMSGYYEGAGDMPNAQTARPVNDHVKKLISMTANEMGKGNAQLSNTYAAIFEDTAMHTLPQQLANDTSVGSGMGALQAAGMQNQKEQVAPAQLEAMAHDGDITHWAKLAFHK